MKCVMEDVKRMYEGGSGRIISCILDACGKHKVNGTDVLRLFHDFVYSVSEYELVLGSKILINKVIGTTVVEEVWL